MNARYLIGLVMMLFCGCSDHGKEIDRKRFKQIILVMDAEEVRYNGLTKKAFITIQPAGKRKIQERTS